jgi:hypothetical protein
VGRGGGFGPARRGARAREGAGPAAAHGRGDGASAQERRRHRGAHTSARAEGETASRVDGAGEPAVRRERKTGCRWARRRFAAGGLVLGPRGGGLARAGAGDPRGRLDSARGDREGAVRGEVAELRGGDCRRWSLGEGLGRGSGVLSSRQCEEAARLSQSLAGPTEREREEGEELTGEGEDGGASRIGLGRGEEGGGRGRCGEGGARGDLFIGARGEGSGGARRAPVRCTAPALMSHSGDDETPRRGSTGPGRGQAARMGRCRTLPVRRGDGRGDGDGGDGGASYARKTTTWLTGGAGLPVRGSVRERGAGSSARGGERGAAGGFARASGPANGPKGGSAGARGGEVAAAWAGFWPSGRGEAYPFSFFYFLNPISIFVPFLFEQII